MPALFFLGAAAMQAPCPSYKFRHPPLIMTSKKRRKVRMDRRDTVANTVKRELSKDSPVWIPGLINLLFIIICCAIYLFNMPSESVKKIHSGGFFSDKSIR